MTGANGPPGMQIRSNTSSQASKQGGTRGSLPHAHDLLHNLLALLRQSGDYDDRHDKEQKKRENEEGKHL